MNKLTIKAYAVKHKLSIFNVIKMIKAGKLNTEIKEENGSEVTYILHDKDMDLKKVDNKMNVDKEMDFEKEVLYLKNEIKILKNEIELLKTISQRT